jgi:DNA invertase Pin-like site-specific DNA recombinase
MWQLPAGIKPENIIIYLRKSRADDPLLTVEEVLAKHEQMLDDWVARNLPGLGPVPEANRYREVVSGETLDSRPQVQEVLRRAESPRVRGVLIVEPQRLSRGDLEDIGRLVKLLRYSNTLAITLPYTYDLRDERDRDMFERELKRGNEFLEYQKRIMTNGRLLSVQNGNFIGQTAPYGYDKVQIKEGRKKCHTLTPNPETAPVVKLIFEMYRDGMGTTRIADHLDALGVPAPSGGKWSPETLPRFLRNEHYIGKVVWNKRAEVRHIEDGEVVVSRPIAEEYLVYEGKHPAIIDQELWDAVQEIRGKIPPNPKAHNFVNPLAGLLFCKKCNRVMTRRTYRDPKTGKERSAPRVACTDQRNCHTASAALEEVLAEVVKVLRETVDDFEIRIDRGADDSLEIHRQMVARLEKRLIELQELEITQWDEKTKGKMPAHVFERLNAQTLAEMEAVQQELCTAKGSIPEPIDLQARQLTFQAALDALTDPDAPAKEQNRLLKACIERIDYYRNKTSRRIPRGQSDPDAPIMLTFQLRI